MRGPGRSPTALRLGIALACIYSAAPRVARSEGVDDIGLARERYRRATRLFDLRRYHDAAREFEGAYEAKDDPALLYNIAQSYRLAGEYDDAVGTYRSYLRRNPKASNRQEVEDCIAELQVLVGQQQQAQSRLPMGTMPPSRIPDAERPDASSAADEKGQPSRKSKSARSGGSDEKRNASKVAMRDDAVHGGGSARGTDGPTESGERLRSEDTRAASEPEAPPVPGRGKKIAGVVVAAVGVIAIGVGIGLGVDGAGQRDRLNHPSAGQAYDPGIDQNAAEVSAAGVALGVVGAVACVAGAALFALGIRDQRLDAAHVALAPLVGGGTVGAAMSVRF